MLLLRHAQTGGALPPKRRMETAHERLLPNRVAVQYAGPGASNTTNTTSVLHSACSTDANTLVPLRADRLHHADAHIELRGGSDHALVERVDQLRKFLHYSHRVLPHALGDDGYPRRLCHRVPNGKRRVAECLQRRVANAHLHQRPALGNVHVPIVYTCRHRHVYPACGTDTNTLMPPGPNRFHHAEAHLKLRRGGDHALVERLDQLRKFLRHSHRVLHHSVGDDSHARQLCDRQPHLIRCVRQLVRERAAYV